MGFCKHTPFTKRVLGIEVNAINCFEGPPVPGNMRCRGAKQLLTFGDLIFDKAVPLIDNQAPRLSMFKTDS